MRLSTVEIAKAVNGHLIGSDSVLEGVSIDTRTLKPGNLYLAIVGQRFDGHDFIEAAEQGGAQAVLVSKQQTTSLPQILVQDTHAALAQLAAYWRGSLPVKIAGVTGSNGKTTVKEMIAAIFATQGQTLHTRGNLNNDIGVPLTLLRLTAEHRYAVIEMGANHRGEIAYTSRIAQAEVSVINNVGSAHLEGFGSIEGVAAAKGEIIESLGESGVAVINRDDAFYDFWLQLADKRKSVSFGLHAAADVKASDIRSALEHGQFIMRFQLHANGRNQPMELALAGEHNVRNALAAAAVALQFDIGLADIASGLQAMQPVTGRMQPLKGQLGNIIIDDTYNANPSSLQAALDSLDRSNDVAWLVLGAFGELGADSQELHRQMGEMIKHKGIARLFATGADAQQTANAFGDGGEYYDSQEQLILALKHAMTGTETILVKGSRAQKMENVVAALVDNFRAA